MFFQVLAHGETLDPLVAEDGLHGGVRGEELLVLGILKVRLLQVRPQPLDDLREKSYQIGFPKIEVKSYLRSGDFLSLVRPDDGGELLGHVKLHVNAGFLDG